MPMAKTLIKRQKGAMVVTKINLVKSKSDFKKQTILHEKDFQHLLYWGRLRRRPHHVRHCQQMPAYTGNRSGHQRRPYCAVEYGKSGQPAYLRARPQGNRGGKQGKKPLLFNQSGRGHRCCRYDIHIREHPHQNLWKGEGTGGRP